MARYKATKFILSIFFVLLSFHVSAQSDEFFTRLESGEISESDPSHEYSVSVQTNGILEIRMVPEGNLDTRLFLLYENGLILAENDDVSDRKSDGSALFVPVSEGTYTVVADNRGDTRGAYQLDIDFRSAEHPIDSLDLSNDDILAMGFPESSPHDQAVWTIFAYYGADSNLEQAILEDTHEFELAGGSDDDVRIIVLLDRHPQYSVEDENWTETHLYEISGDSDATLGEVINSAPIKILDELDMGNPDTLAAFLIWGIDSYPAENYALAFSSHGSGWGGVMLDETNENSRLTLNSLRQVFETVKSETEFDKFDLVINDACLMASVEYYDVMQDYVDISIGSSAMVINPALDMTLLVQRLHEGILFGEADLNAIGRELIDKYITVDAPTTSNLRNFTQAITDLSKMGSVDLRLRQFSVIVNNDPQRYIPTLAQARANAYAYDLPPAVEYIDLGDFMKQIKAFSTDETLIQAAQQVIDALANARIYGSAQEGAVEHTSYYNIYFPIRARNLNNYVEQSGLTSWAQMLINYFAYSRFEFRREGSDGFHEPQEPQINITRTIPENNIATFNLPIAIDLEILANNVARGTFYVEQIINEDTSVRVLAQPMLQDVQIPEAFEPLPNQNIWQPGVDKRTIKWNAGAFQLFGENEQNIEYFQQAFDESGSYFLEGQYRRVETDSWINVKVTFTRDDMRAFDLRSSTFISINDVSGTFGIFEPEVGGQLQVYRSEVDLDDEDVDVEENGNIYTIPEGGLGATLVPVESDEYLLRFIVESFGDDAEQEVQTVTVDNDNIDPDWRGQNYIGELGFSVSVPESWGADFDEIIGAVSIDAVNVVTPRNTNPYENAVIALYDYPNVINPEEALLRFVNILTPPSEPVQLSSPYVLAEHEVQEFSYQEGQRSVRGIVTFNQALNTSLVFTVENRFSQPNITDELFEALIPKIIFYDEVPESRSQWRSIQISPEQSASVPIEWVLDDSGDGWLSFHDPINSNLRIAFRTENETSSSIQDYASQHLPDIDLGNVTEQTYASENHVWQSLQYQIEIDNVPYIGRLYRTVQEANNKAYYALVTAPERDAEDYFVDLLEPSINSIAIENLSYHYDFSDSVGISFDIPNPLSLLNPFYPARQSTLTGTDIALIQSPRGDKRLEMYFVPDVSLDETLEWFANYWGEYGDAYQLHAYEFVEIKNQRALEMEVAITNYGLEWHGRYFTVYSEADNMLYIIGARSLDGSSIVQEYQLLRDSVEFNFGNFDLYTSIRDRALFDPQYAFDMDIWSFSEPMVYRRKLYTRGDLIRFPDDRFAIEIIYVFGVTSDDFVQELTAINLGIFFNDPETYHLTRIDNRPAFESNLSAYALLSFAVYDEEQSRIVLVAVTDGERLDDSRHQEIYNRLRDSFRIIPIL